MSELQLGQVIHGFKVEAINETPEINGTAYVMLHEKSGAKLLHLNVRDEEKGFAIGFRTYPEDNTGVFHILEHSVLCGSDKYPVKDPFVHLAKSSMQTFLNAMTGPNFTMYPVASTNEKDLMNLMSIYLDAVFHPVILHEPRIFKQEGWHYEIEGDYVVANGVVYNEMKGGLSNPSTVLYHAIMDELFPDTAFRFESGGRPGEIENLAYEKFVETYRRHYRPDNAAIVLYGELDLETILAKIDEEYLANYQEPDGIGKPNTTNSQNPVVSTGRKAYVKALPQDSKAAFACVFADRNDTQRIGAMQMLGGALLRTSESPLKRKLLDAGFADDFSFGLGMGDKAYFTITATNAKPDSGQVLLDAIQQGVREILAEGFNQELLKTETFASEFHLRTGGPMGKMPASSQMQACLAHWASVGKLDESALRYESDLEFVKQAMGTGYYEKLAEETFLNSDHYAVVELVPTEDPSADGSEGGIHLPTSEFDQAELERIQQEADDLKRFQDEPESPEALKSLPRLERADVMEAPDYAGYQMEDANGLPVLRHDYEDAGIAHILRYYDISSLTLEEWQLLMPLMSLITQTHTKRHSAYEIGQLRDGRLGSIFAQTTTGIHNKTGLTNAYAWVYTCSLTDDIEFTSEFVDEVLHETLFDDRKRLREIIDRFYNIRKMLVVDRIPHAVAATRATAHFSTAALLNDANEGIQGYRFIKELKERIEDDAEADKTLRELEVLCARVFGKRPVLISYAGNDEALARFAAEELKRVPVYERQAQDFLADAAVSEEDAPARVPIVELPPLSCGDEAFVIPGDSAYCAQALDLSETPSCKLGRWAVAGKLASLDYLWNEVRVKGGAYGVSFSEMRNGEASFSSFRDPQVDGTLERFEELGTWLCNTEPSDEELDGYVISCAASFDRPTKALMRVLGQCSAYLSGWSLEDRAAQRQDIVACTADEVRELGRELASCENSRHTVVIASRELIEGSSREFVVEELG